MKKSFRKNILTGSALLAGIIATAQDAAVTAVPVVPNTASSDNLMLYLLLAACAVLLIAVLLLGNVMVSLTKIAFDKRARKTLAVLLLLLCTNFLFAQDAPVAVDNSFKLPANYDVWVGAFVFAIELMVMVWMLITIRSLLAEISDEKKELKSWNFHLPKIFDNINASVAIEKEQDILLDHNYDGIRELDNALPPWWKYSFYISIVWAIGYLGYFYFGGGPTSHDEYVAEVQQAKIDVEAYNKKNALNIDEGNVKYADAAGITDGQEIFKTNCAACHGNAGEGNVGPNLTDDYWLHGGSANDLFKTVKYGWPAKGMKSWQSDLSAVQIKNVISYIHSIRGTNPANAKAPQGDLFTEGGAAIKTDSTVVAVADTTKK